MKKRSLLCLLLAFAVFAQTLFLPVYAETEGTEPSAVPSTQTPEETYTLPSEVSGDASVNMGCHSINALTPLAGAMEFNAKCKGAILYEIDTGTMVFSHNPDTKLYPASTTKIMTCLIALERGNLSDVVTASEEAIAQIDASSSSIDLVVGEQMTLENLLYGLMVSSGNDAAIVISEHIAGSEAEFVDLMNQKAKEIGCTGTHFANAHGLHDEEHYTTARDMAKIMLAALEYEKFHELYSTAYYNIPATNKSGVRQLTSTNYLITETILFAYQDSRVIGGKTGFTTPAGRCLITVSESNGMRMLCVVLGAETEYSDDGYTMLSIGSFEQTIKLMNLGYNNYKAAQILSPDMVVEQFNVTDGQTAAQGVVKQSSMSVVPADCDLNTLRFEYDLDGGGITAPVQQDQSLGVVRVWYQAKCLAQQELFAAAPVEKAIRVNNSGTPVSPALPIEDSGDLWHIVLVAVLVLLGVIVLMLAVSFLRAAIIRANRKKRRRNRRRSR